LELDADQPKLRDLVEKYRVRKEKPALDIEWQPLARNFSNATSLGSREFPKTALENPLDRFLTFR
jgi:hypothetical protein